MRTENEFRALLVLLSDDEERVAAVARDTLLSEWEVAVPYLQEAAGDPDARLRGRARLLLQDVQMLHLEASWRTLAARPDDDLDLERGCLLLSRLSRDVDEKAVTGFLDAIAGMVRAHMAGSSGLQALNEVLFENLGFKGGEYSDPENFYLASALERRSGIPIVLASIYVLVAQRLGLPVSGVAAPNHYLARYDHEDGPVFVDCYNRGRTYRQETLEGWLSGRGLEESEQYLAPCSNRFTLIRMLNNLERLYADSGDVRLANIVRRLRNVMVRPEEWAE